jgi:16S rRNA A1518/A1519 N6-dimethyltransferase RsmA/KsgA/DIM1 with predicted DNA glycosylase/AP lyase activity
MSATNRGSKRMESDFYATPEKTTAKFLEHWYGLGNSYILEPSAGNGAICKVIKEWYPTVKIVANEIRKEENENLIKYADSVYHLDFLKFKGSKLDFDLIIGNPPFNQAQEFLEKCFEIASDDTDIVMLLRLAFLESRKRYEFWQKYPLYRLFVLSERPSFINGKTDATAYGWFVWRKSSKEQGIFVI